MPNQEPGTKVQRPLPYRFQIDDAQVGSGSGNTGTGIAIKISNTGTVGAAFSVHNYGPNCGTCKPMRYTIDAGKSLTSTWTDSRYNISLHGPNGYVRKFSGDAAAASAAVVSFRDAGGAVAAGSEAAVLQMRLGGAGAGAGGTRSTVSRGCAVSVEVKDNEYDLGGPWSFSLQSAGNGSAGATAGADGMQHRVLTASSGNWYDLTVTTHLNCVNADSGSSSSSTYTRRYMGKIETVHATTTDPAMAKGAPADAGSATHPTIPDAVRKLMISSSRATHPVAAKEGKNERVQETLAGGSCSASSPNKDACYHA